MPGVPNQGPGTFQTLFTMTGFGLSAFLLGPLYLLSEFLNIPVTSMNMLSRQSFEEQKVSFLHLPIYKALQGCPTKELVPEKFDLQDNMYISNKLAVVSCHLKKDNGSKVTQNDTRMSDSILDMIGMIPSDHKLEHYVFQLFHYIENIRATDEERKVDIHRLVRKVNDYRTMMKIYLIYRTLDEKNICSSVSKKTILKDEDVVKMNNPFYIPCKVPFNTRIKCAWSHLFKSKFGPDEADCRAECDTCTFQNSLGRLTRKYTSFLSGGCNASVVRSMINTYFSYIHVGKTDQIPKEEGIMAYLDRLKLEPSIKPSIDKKVIEKFNTFICKYDLVPLLKEEIQKKLKEKLEGGYEMSELLSFIYDDSKQKLV
jgi:hypothetical protein